MYKFNLKLNHFLFLIQINTDIYLFIYFNYKFLIFNQ